MTRLLTAGAVVLMLLTVQRVAHAEGSLPNGVTLNWQRLLIHEGTSDLKEASNSESLRRQLNLAHCKCARVGAGDEVEIAYELSSTGSTLSGRAAEIHAGTSCNDDLLRPQQCKPLGGIPDIDQLAIAPPTLVKFTAYDLVNGGPAFTPTPEMPEPPVCKEREGAGEIWVLWDEGNGAPFEFSEAKSVGVTPAFPDVMGIDTLAPEQPTDFVARGGEGTIEVSWTLPLARPMDIFAFQAMCLNLSNNTPVTTSPPAPQFQRTDDVCATPDDITFKTAEVRSGPTDMVIGLPPEFESLDGAFLCGTQPSGTATGITIRGLENDVPYAVAILVIDYYGNVRPVFLTSTVTPTLVTDLWEDLHENGGEIEGGFCLIAKTYGDQGPITQTLRAFRDETLASTVFGRALIDAYYATLGKAGWLVGESVVVRAIAAVLLAPLVLLALMWHFLSLPVTLLLLASPWWLRRVRPVLASRRLRLAAATGGALVVFAPTAARADDFLPYWQDAPTEDQALADIEDRVKWHVGFRLGPYTPDVDKNLPKNAFGKGPYAQMFGNYRLGDSYYDAHIYQIMPMLDVDRVLFRRFGQWTVGASLGYMQKTAHAYTQESSPDDEVRDRTPNADNTFRLIPFSLNIGYRMTLLDEELGIPVVPYAKLGLAYYTWWIKGPDGNVAKVCENGMPVDTDPTCKTNDALGASAGFQGTIGLSIRAERIDIDAARSMQQSGIYHAGFFAELMYARVDGFGSSSKLSVGGATWFAGVEFEF